MSVDIYTHTHREPSTFGTSRYAVHHPDGTLRGYVEKVLTEVTTIHLDGRRTHAARFLWTAQDEHGRDLAGGLETKYRAIEWVVER